MLHLLLLLLLLSGVRPSSALDFLLNFFNSSDHLILVEDARIDLATAVLSLSNDTNQFSYGRAFYPSRIPMRHSNSSGAGGGASGLTSFSTSFVFSILPEIDTSPGFGLAFVLSNSTSPDGALAGQYFGLFTNATTPFVAPLLAVEFDVGMNPEFNDPDGNHVGIDLNNMVSTSTETARYFSSATGGFVPVDMRSGQNVRAWIDFDGPRFEFNITIAPAWVPRPSIPLLSYADPDVARYVSDEMYVGFSASKTTWVEAQRILAWSFSDTGLARDINTTRLPNFSPETTSSSLSGGVIAGITIAGSVLFGVLCLSGVLWYRHGRGKKNNRREGDGDGIEEWELEYWPHRFSYEELNQATGDFSERHLIGSGGFGKVYKGVLKNSAEVAVKCVNHDSKQGIREFMAEISSMGRLQHKNLVQMRGWCRRQNQLMLVYDFMPHGSLNRWIFDSAEKVLDWPRRRRVLADVAEGLNYLHHGWDQVVVHRDIKASNVLLDADMKARLGDFGLAKLYSQGEKPTATRLVGTLGYLAPELATSSTPTAASDVYSFGVVVMEVSCGRRPIETWRRDDEEQVLVDWARELYRSGRLAAAADRRIAAECSLEEAEAVLKLGLACCHPDPLRRPSMKEVVALLMGQESPAGIPPPDFLSKLSSAGDGHGVEAQSSSHDPQRH